LQPNILLLLREALQRISEKEPFLHPRNLKRNHRNPATPDKYIITLGFTGDMSLKIILDQKA